MHLFFTFLMCNEFEACFSSRNHHILDLLPFAPLGLHFFCSVDLYKAEKKFRLVWRKQCFPYLPLGRMELSVSLEVTGLERLNELLKGYTVFLKPVNVVKIYLAAYLLLGTIRYSMSMVKLTFSSLSRGSRRSKRASL